MAAERRRDEHVVTGAQHYTEAERLIMRADSMFGDSQVGDPYPAAAHYIAAAQVHATLALAAATVQPIISTERNGINPSPSDWRIAVGR